MKTVPWPQDALCWLHTKVVDPHKGETLARRPSGEGGILGAASQEVPRDEDPGLAGLGGRSPSALSGHQSNQNIQSLWGREENARNGLECAALREINQGPNQG